MGGIIGWFFWRNHGFSDVGSALVFFTENLSVKHSFLDKYSHQKSAVHSLDTRFKIILFFSFVILVTLTPASKSKLLLGFWLAFFFLLFLSRLLFKYFFSRIILAGPVILTLIIFVFFHKGIFAGFFYFFKSLLCVAVLILFSATTPFDKFLKALEWLKVPVVFIQILSFMYRYLFVLEDELGRMRMALASRTFQPKNFLIFRGLTNFLGVFFVRAYERSERIYWAMLSRGFRTENESS